MSDSGLRHHGQYIAVDCRKADIELWSERTRALATTCLKKRINRVLIDATDCDADGHHALREALTALILGGLPGGFRLALVTNVARLQAFFGTLQRDLHYLQIPARCFADEGEAIDWLMSAPAPRAAAERTGAGQRA